MVGLTSITRASSLSSSSSWSLLTMIVGVVCLATSAVIFIVPSAHALDTYPGAQPEESSAAEKAEIHKLISGRVKRMSGDVQPESVEFVRGIKSTQTYSLLNNVRSKEVVNFYHKQLSLAGQILFECDGRDCGSSSYWSNQVFGRPFLYGPLEYQHYFLAKLKGDNSQYVTVYLAERATGKRYIHVETISEVVGDTLVDSRLMLSALRLQKRFVIEFDPDAEALNVLRDVINESATQSLVLVAHSSLIKGETFTSGVERTEQHVAAVKSKLEEMGTDTRDLSVFGAGPSVPIENSERLELVKLK